MCGLTVALPKEQATLTPAFVKALTDAMNQPDTYFEELMAKVVDGGAAEDDFAVSGWMAGRCGCGCGLAARSRDEAGEAVDLCETGQGVRAVADRRLNTKKIIGTAIVIHKPFFLRLPLLLV